MGNYKHDLLEHKMCEEVQMIEKKYENSNGDMSIDDIKKLDLLYHALKSKATYDAMKEAEEFGQESRMSGRGGYSRTSGYYEDPNYPGYSGTHYPPRPRW